MLRVLIADKRADEAILIRSIVKDCVAMRSSEQTEVTTYKVGDYSGIKADYADLMIVAVDNKSDLDFVRQLRVLYEEAHLFLLVNRKMSPEKYVKPYTRPISIVVDTYSNTELYYALDETVEVILKKRPGYKSSLRIETRQDVVHIPYGSIFSIEAAAKKIIIKLKNEEYVCYGTLDSMMESLSGSFVRCHRSFIVNVENVRSYSPSDSLITMKNGEKIPVSRSYKMYVRRVV